MTERELHALLCWSLIGLAVVTFVALLFVAAPYGRHQRAGWGPTLPARWLWVVMEAPACVGFLGVYLAGSARFRLVPLVLLGLWQLHYVDRTFLYPLRIRAEGKRSPVAVALMGASFQALNAYLNARFLSELGDYATSWLCDPRFLVGAALFFAGRHLNRTSDRALIALREEGPGYRVPHGGWFRLVSCPNYLGEMLEWAGWALATWSLAGAAFALYTVANLIPRALAHHRWYRQTFPRYPPSRRAVIPFLL